MDLPNVVSPGNGNRCFKTVNADKFRDNVRTCLVALQPEKTDVISMSIQERSSKFLWAAFNGDIQAMESLLAQGVSVDSVDPKKGLTALHLAALNGFTETIKWLLARKCNFVRSKSDYTALHFAVVSRSKKACMLLVEHGCPVDKLILHSAVQADAINCLQYFLRLKAAVNEYDNAGLTPLHTAVNLDNFEALCLLLDDQRVHVTAKTKNERYNALHIAAYNGSVDILKTLLKKGLNANETCSSRETPLHLACKKQHLACVEALLMFGAEADVRDNHHRTPIFAAISDSPSSSLIMEQLIQHKGNINQADCKGNTPLHVAALNGLEDCVNFLIMNGSNVTAKSSKNISALSIIRRNTPFSLPKIQERLNHSLELCDNRYLRFNFEEVVNNSRIGETCYLYDMQDEHQAEVLEHPVCRAFLHFKWQRMRLLILVRIMIVFFTVCLMSAYMLWAIGRGCYNRAFAKIHVQTACNNQSFIGGLLIKHPNIMKVTWTVILVMVFLNTIRIILTLPGARSVSHYFLKPFNLLELCLTILILLLAKRDKNESMYRWQTTVAAVVVLMSWIYLMFMFSYLSTFGVYVIMFNAVLKEFSKVMITFICLLIGFTFTFCILESETFIDPIAGFVKTIGMMTGELYVYDIIDKDDLMDNTTKREDYWWERYVTISVVALFMIFITIALMNMFISLVVNDVSALQTKAHPWRHIQQTKLIYTIEKCCLDGLFPACVVKRLKQILYVWRGSSIKEVLVESHDLHDIGVLPSDVIESAIRVAVSQLRRNQEAKRQALQTSPAVLENDIRELQRLVKTLALSVQKMFMIIETRLPEPINIENSKN